MRPKQQRAERHLLASDRDLTPQSSARRRELTLFVILPIVWKVGLRNHSQDAPLAKGDRTVEELPLGAQRHSNNQQRWDPSAGGGDRLDRSLASIQQRALVEKVLGRIGAQAELWIDHQRRATVGRLPREAEGLVGVEVRLGHPDLRNGHRAAHETVAIQ